jgi:hypothetical protein
MHVNRLVVTVEATHQSLQERIEAATGSAVRRPPPRHGRARTDAFLAATSRHLAAVDEALLPVLRRRLPDGEKRVKAYLHQARRLELALATLKARLYGAVAASHIPWEEVWDDARRELTRHNDMERELVDDLVLATDHDVHDELADRLYRAELRAPTRAHPYLPHRGALGLAARRVWAVADRFWDTAEDRMVPQPVRPPSKEHAHDSLMAQYLTGEPRFEADAPVFAHHRQRGRSGAGPGPGAAGR